MSYDVEARNIVAPAFRELETIVDEIARLRREVQDLKGENIGLRAQIIEPGGDPK